MWNHLCEGSLSPKTYKKVLKRGTAGECGKHYICRHQFETLAFDHRPECEGKVQVVLICPGKVKTSLCADSLKLWLVPICLFAGDLFSTYMSCSR